MSREFEVLPEAVRQALQQGRPLDAIRLLREAKGISLKAARSRVESAVAKGVPGPAHDAASAAATPGSGQPGDVGWGAVIARLHQALQQAGRKRAGLPEVAPQRVEPGSLAPGEQPRSGGLGDWLVVALVALALALLYRRFG